MYLAVVAQLDPTVEVPPGLLQKVQDRVAAGDHRGAGALIPDDLLDLFAFSGTPEQVAAQAQRLIDAGADRIEFGTPHGLRDDTGVELIGQRVVPLLDRRPGRSVPRRGTCWPSVGWRTREPVRRRHRAGGAR